MFVMISEFKFKYYNVCLQIAMIVRNIITNVCYLDDNRKVLIFLKVCDDMMKIVSAT